MTDDKQLGAASAWFAGVLNQRKRLRAFELIAGPSLWAVLLEDFVSDRDRLPIALVFLDETAARAFLAKYAGCELSALDILREELAGADEISRERFTLRQHH
jgi:hypothetical protein